MQEFPFQKFINLVSFDRELVALEKTIKKHEAEIIALQDNLDALEQEELVAKKEKDEAQKLVHEKELHMKELDESQKAAEKKMDAVNDNKSYQSVKHEIESLKKQQHDYEDELVAAWNDLETHTKALAHKKEEIVQKLQECTELLNQKEDALVAHKKELLLMVEKRDSQKDGIPEEWLEKYAMMRSSVDNPVVPVKLGACSGCFYQITNQDLARLRNNALLQCRDCYRFLYMESRDDAA